MKEYEIVAVLWQDHQQIVRDILPKNPDSIVENCTLSVGIILEETKKCILLVSDIERTQDKDDATYLIILKSTIESIKKYGKIKLKVHR